MELLNDPVLSYIVILAKNLSQINSKRESFLVCVHFVILLCIQFKLCIYYINDILECVNVSVIYIYVYHGEHILISMLHTKNNGQESIQVFGKIYLLVTIVQFDIAYFLYSCLFSTINRLLLSKELYVCFLVLNFELFFPDYLKPFSSFFFR